MKYRKVAIALTVALTLVTSLGATRDEVAQHLHIDPRASNRILSIASNLYNLRIQLELYRIQHEDSTAMKEMNAWQALAGKSKLDGSPSTTFSDPGPYINALPQNPFTRSTCVVPAGLPCAGAGWTYDEKSFHLRAIIPENCAQEATFLPAEDYELLSPHGLTFATTIRTAEVGLILYKIHHNKRFPTMQEMLDWKPILTHEQNHNSALPQAATVLMDPPLNPLTNSTRIVPAGHPTSDAGWTYDEESGTVRAIIPSSKIKTIHELAESQYELLPPV